MTDLNCPGCTATMKRFNIGKLELDRCVFCRGLWFDGGELEQALGKRLPGQLTKEQESTRHCPRCKTTMTPAIVGGLRVEFCEKCNGVFLDDGELTALNGGKPVRIQAGEKPPPARPDKAVQDDLMKWLDTLGA